MTFTSLLVDGEPTDRLDDGNSPLPAGAMEMFVSVRYAGLSAADEAKIVLTLNGDPVGEPSLIDIDTSGGGLASLRLYQDDGTPIPSGIYAATVSLNGAVIADAGAIVLSG